MANMIVLLPDKVSRSEEQFLRFLMLIIADILEKYFTENSLNQQVLQMFKKYSRTFLEHLKNKHVITR